MQVVPKGSPQDESTTQLVHRLRDDVDPRRDARAPTLDVHVGGQTAIGVDLADTLGPAPALHVPRDPVAQLRPADARVPIAARAAQGRDHEPAVDRRRVRRDRRDLPVRLGQERRRHRQGRPDRGVGADDAVRDRVRPLDGLRGVPARRGSRRSTTAPATTRPRSRTGSPRPPGSSPPRPRS